MYENVYDITLNEDKKVKKEKDMVESKETLKMSLEGSKEISEELGLEKKILEFEPENAAKDSRRQLEEKLGADFLPMIKGIKTSLDAVPKIGASDEFVQLIIKNGGVWMFSKTLLDMCMYLAPYVETAEEKEILEEVIDTLLTMYLKKAKERKEWEDHLAKGE